MEVLARSILAIPELNPLPQMLEGGALPALISGLAPVHRANLAAAMYLETGKPLIAVCPDDTAAETMAKTLASFLGLDEIPVLLSRSLALYNAEGVSHSAEQRRLQLLYELAEGKCRLAVCTVSALLQRTAPPEKLMGAAVRFGADKPLGPDEIQAALLRCGYSPTQQVEGPGQFSRRGGILDFYSPAYPYPIRCDFWGDELDSMGFFDVQTQRRTENLTECLILPAAEILPEYYPGGASALAERLRQQAKKLPAGKKALDQELRQDADRLENSQSLRSADRYLELICGVRASALDYLPGDALILLDQPGKLAEHGKEYLRELGEDAKEQVSAGRMPAEWTGFALELSELFDALGEFPLIETDAFTMGRSPIEPRSIVSVQARQLSSYGGNGEAVANEVEGFLKLKYRTVILAADERRAQLLRQILEEHGVNSGYEEKLSSIPEKGGCMVTIGGLAAGYDYPGIRLAVLSDTQFVRRAEKKRRLRTGHDIKEKKKLGSYADLAVGDLVVHEIHGIGKFEGVVKMPVDGAEKDYIKIRYAGSDSLYVPATQLDLVSKYVGGGDNPDRPMKLSKMGGTEWKKTKSRAKASAKAMAKELIALYAQRRAQPGYAFQPDSAWQQEFEDAFGYMETDDQLRSVQEIKDDMESAVPMDRLLCGDVGFGKTEVALRAVMKCVLDGKQAAILVPTTVLAQQHYQTAMQRFFGYPVKIDVLSRFRTPAQVKNTLRDLHNGSVDIIIGTHRLFQKDVKFKDLGLLVIDEEQRFGVSHKERLREMAKQVDTLTLSATPIPRTLNMALSGIRDMSMLEEPPQNRQPVQTYVMEHDWGVLCDAIRREIQRGGQVFYLHNRTDSIDSTAFKLANMLEGVSVAVAHGKMSQEQLSGVMEDMVSGEVQVLVCTTIIETGIDIPNVNTLIIEDADRLGLAQLHQIRGRVGRSGRRASAYLTFRRDKVLTEVAEKRLSAIREFAEFNSGFKIAMRDLEIRGAGNLLGAEQSGHMIDVGYDMYLKLLEEAVLEEKGEKPVQRAECAADLAVSANIPEGYVPSSEQRMDLYRRIAMIRTEEEADDLTDELIDRFGDPPPGVNALIHVALLRGEAGRAGVLDISQRQGSLLFRLRSFDMQRYTQLFGMKQYKGRLKLESGDTPCVRLLLNSKRRAIEEARAFVSDYGAAGAN
ncbi:MAG: transcription-repair coupling factor [Candidatus Heteroscillospira sp.]|jgi:transcription-repair coupling factor (superfamily II helicase)